MQDRTIARTYAAALFDLGVRHDEEDRYAAAFEELSGLLSEDRVRRFLDTPKIEVEEKQRVVRTALEGRVPERFLRFLLVVIARGRQRQLPRIRVEYRDMVDERSGKVHAEVTLAREPDEAMERLIADRLSELLGKTVVPSIRVDPEILGGLIVRYQDKAMDASLRRQLASLRREMLHSTLPELPASA